VAGEELGVIGAVQVEDFPARLAVPAGQPDLAAAVARVAVVLGNERQAERAVVEIDPGQVDALAVGLPPVGPRLPALLAALLVGPDRHGRGLLTGDAPEQLLDLPAE